MPWRSSGGHHCNETDVRGGSEGAGDDRALARRTPYLASLGTRVEQVRSNPPAKHAIASPLSC